MSKKNTQVLNEGWEFQCDGESDWLNATVPGCVHLDLLNHELIPDPYFGLNEQKLQWISKKSWNYKLHFTPEKELQQKKNKRLCFYGIDTYATVYLNGKKIISANNMFHPWEVDVTDIIVPGRNELNVKLHSPINKILPHIESMNYKLPAENDQAGGTSPYTRKAPYHYGWDWGPCFVTSGIWQEVELFGWNSWFIKNIFIRQEKCDKDRADLTLEVDIESKNNKSGKIIIFEPKSEIFYEHPIKFSKGENKLYFDLVVVKPELWWPAGHGDQPLYDFQVTIHADGEEEKFSKRTGLRDVAINRVKDEKGESFTIYVNGKPIFAKGANWIPADSFTSRLTPKDYKLLLQNVIKANMNTLRMWGGGIYEPDYFYELCDQMGILVWQDFMFACSLYPADNEFLNSVKQEVTYQVNRLKDHSCVILWCGNNEVASGWLSWGWKEKLPESVWEKDYKKLFHELIPDICNELDSSRLYWPSSPGHDLELPKDDQIYGNGDNHYWGVWHGGEGFEGFEKNIGRFMSEYGMQSFPDLKTVETFANKVDWDIESDVIKAHQKASLGNDNVIKYIEQYYSKPKDFESLIPLSQIMQADAIRTAVEAHRRSMPFCMGTLYWQLNDCWPGVSWSSIDYNGNWKALHYAARIFFNPVLVSITEKDNLINIYIINDQDLSFNAELSVILYSFNGSVLVEQTKAIEVSSTCSTKALKLSSDKLIGNHDQSEIMLCCELKKDGTSITKNNFFFFKPKDLKLTKPKFDYQHEIIDNRYFIIIYSYNFIHKLYINCLNCRGIFSNNYFEMLPNEKIKIEFEPIEKLENNCNSLSFDFKSFYDLIN